MPAFVRGSVFPPIPFRVTEGMRYSLHVFIFDSKVECERIAFAIVPVEVRYPDRIVGIALLL